MNDENNMVIEDPARIAVYDDLLSAPRVVDVPPQEIREFIESIAVTAYELSRQQGGQLPYTVIREITENFIHAGFLECTVSILDEGNTLRFADQGPGITKKDLVLQPGISSATHWMKNYIRGVGSGFPVVREYLAVSHGYMSIEDNAEDGVVVTISLVPAPGAMTAGPIAGPVAGPVAGSGLPLTQELLADRFKAQVPVTGVSLTDNPPARADYVSDQLPRLSAREEQALLLLNEHGLLGPVDLAELQGFSASTATRLLQKLEQAGMVESTYPAKKRILSNAGMAYIQGLLV